MLDMSTLKTSTLTRLVTTGLYADAAEAELKVRLAPPTRKAIPAPARRPIKQSNGDVDLSRYVPGFRRPEWRGERDRGPRPR